METRKELKIFWWAPAATFLFHLLLVILMAYGPRNIGTLAAELYEPMFFVTPLVGIIVLLSLLVVFSLHRACDIQCVTLRTMQVRQ